MKKFPTIKGVLHNIRGSVNSSEKSVSGRWLNWRGNNNSGVPARLESEILETLIADNFRLEKTTIHGCPNHPTVLAFDPVQRLIAVGAKEGIVRVMGKTGVDITIRHDKPCDVKQLFWVINAGQLITVLSDNSLCLWNLKTPEPELVNTIQFQSQKVTQVYAAFKSKWVYVGTDKGNVNVLNLDTFTLSGYIINWNKAIGLTEKVHPGSVSHISENPADPSKILIGFSGLTTSSLSIWDFQTKVAAERFIVPTKFTSVSWLYDGTKFIVGCTDGSLVTFELKTATRKQTMTVVFPYEKSCAPDQELSPIDKVEWVMPKPDESCIVFSGGNPTDITGSQPGITFMQEKSITMVEVEHTIIDFTLITDSIYRSVKSSPESILVLLDCNLVAIDCRAPGIPFYEKPDSIHIQDSPVTCSEYIVDCSASLIENLTNWGKKGSSKESSEPAWPASGGWTPVGAKEGSTYRELLVTGHLDGSVWFWNVSNNSMKSLYRIWTSRYFEKNEKPSSDGKTETKQEEPYGISKICLSKNGDYLLVAGASGQVLFFDLRYGGKRRPETPVLEIPIIYEVSTDRENSPHFEFPPKPSLAAASKSSSYTDPCTEGFEFDHRPTIEYHSPLKLRSPGQKKPILMPELVCFTPWVNNQKPSEIACLALNTQFGLLAYGNGSGLVIVDYVQLKCLLNMGTADLYGSNDPFHRMPKSPRPLSPTSEYIVKVDLSNYSQVANKEEEEEKKKPERGEENGTSHKDTLSVAGRLKSPHPKSLQKAGTGSSAEDSNNSKSRSSSMGSDDQVVEEEGITAIHFATSFPHRAEYEMQSCLYVGTSLGSVLVIVIQLPEPGEARKSDSVIVSPTCTLLRVKYPVLELSLLDSSFALSSKLSPLEGVRSTSRAGQASPPSPQVCTPSPPQGDQLVLVVAGEKGASVYALPSQRQTSSVNVVEGSNGSYAIKASVVSWGGPKMVPLILFYTSDGVVKGYSLPSLRLMIESKLVTSNTPLIGRTMCFSTAGNGVYLPNPNQVQKFTVNAETIKQLAETRGRCFQENIVMPEAPKKSFLEGAKGLFCSGPKGFDREELFGESSGKASSSLAKTTPGAGAMGTLQSASGGATSEVGKAKQAIMERGQKLNEIEDRTEAMANEAKVWAANSNNLMLHYKNKKWYQL